MAEGKHKRWRSERELWLEKKGREGGVGKTKRNEKKGKKKERQHNVGKGNEWKKAFLVAQPERLSEWWSEIT